MVDLVWRCVVYVSICFFILSCQDAPPLVLVTPEEASKSAARGGFKEVLGGPVIDVKSPSVNEEVENPFPINVVFSPSSAGGAPNMESLRLVYKKMWGIDITDRVIDHIEGNQIKVSEAELPVGEHKVEIYIEDVEGNESRTLISIFVKS